MEIILKSINCDDKIEIRTYNTWYDFINHINTMDEDEVRTAPMLDDAISSIKFYGKDVLIYDGSTVKDLYELAKELIK